MTREEMIQFLFRSGSYPRFGRGRFVEGLKKAGWKVIKPGHSPGYTGFSADFIIVDDPYYRGYTNSDRT